MDLLVQLANLVIRESLVRLDLMAQQVLAVAPVIEVSKALLVLLVSLALQDKMENLVEKARKALLVNEGSLDPQGLEVHQEALVHQVHLVHKEVKESVVLQVLQVRLAFLVLEAYLVLLVTMATQDHLAMQVQQARMAHLVQVVQLAPLVAQVVQVPKVSLVSLVKRVHQVQEENQVHRVHQELWGHLGNVALLDCQA